MHFVSVLHEYGLNHHCKIQFFRHGERAPSRTYTNDPYRDYEWTNGWDQLTNVSLVNFNRINSAELHTVVAG